MLARDLPTAGSQHSHSSSDSRKVATAVPVAGSGDALIATCQRTPSFSIGRHGAEIDVAGRVIRNKSSAGIVFVLFVVPCVP
jgi:hypothetical protein